MRPRSTRNDRALARPQDVGACPGRDPLEKYAPLPLHNLAKYANGYVVLFRIFLRVVSLLLPLLFFLTAFGTLLLILVILFITTALAFLYNLAVFLISASLDFICSRYIFFWNTSGSLRHFCKFLPWSFSFLILFKFRLHITISLCCPISRAHFAFAILFPCLALKDLARFVILRSPDTLVGQTDSFGFGSFSQHNVAFRWVSWRPFRFIKPFRPNLLILDLFSPLV